ncbi:MAG: SDR family NAD(P)-dependent oxidoreductase [Verrucomicrobiales bacterium]
MNFLVTGGAGFIGSHVCEALLLEGHSVWAFDSLHPFYPALIKERNLAAIRAQGGRFEFVLGDLAEPTALRNLFQHVQIDQVIHLAALAGVRPSLEVPETFQQTNVEGTVNLLEAARLSGVRKFIIASTSSVYGVNSKVPFSEDDPTLRIISPYAASKLACEALGHVYHHVYGMDVAILRLFTVYGPRQRPDLAVHKFARLIASGQPVPMFGDGSSARDYTYVSDTVQGLIACTRKQFGFEIFNLGESETVTVRRLIQLLEKALDKPAKIERLPMQAGDVPLTYADISKARAVLGYEPKVKIEEGIDRFVEWFRCQPD